MRRAIVLLFSVIAMNGNCALGAFSFSPGHYYTSDYDSSVITQYNATGTVVGSLNLNNGVRGITFGPDGLLYAVTRPETFGFRVLAINGLGGIEATYSDAVTYIGGNISSGKIAVDASNIYVAGASQVMKFQIGSPASGLPIYTNNQVFDVEVLPSGNLLAASAYEVKEITSSGSVVRDFGPGGLFTDIRGVEYDPSTNNVFVTHLGHSGFFHQVMRFDWLTGNLEESTMFTYADDMFMTNDGNLLVGSRTQVPRLYSQELDAIGGLAGPVQMFVTQFPVPEPSSILMLLAGSLTLCCRRFICGA
jgi:hypothetical protein